MNLERIKLSHPNGTTYDLLFGQDGDQVLLAWLTNEAGGAHVLYASCAVEANYLMEKMSLTNRTDANALLAFLASRGYPAFTSAGYDENGVYEGHKGTWSPA